MDGLILKAVGSGGAREDSRALRRGGRVVVGSQMAWSVGTIQRAIERYVRAERSRCSWCFNRSRRVARS